MYKRQDVSRSPDALNMIADQAFFPIKRTGYKRVAQGSGRVWGLHRLAGGGGEQLLAHIGTALYRVLSLIHIFNLCEWVFFPACDWLVV